MGTGNLPGVERRSFGEVGGGGEAALFTLTGASGTAAAITDYGGIVVSLRTRDRLGRLGEVVLGHETLEGYLAQGNRAYLGALVGRYANRIAHGRFTLDGRSFSLARNDGPNHLHGGAHGFDKVIWSARAAVTARGPRLELSRVSPDGEEGYPGRLAVTVAFTLTEDDALELEFTARTDAPTHCNLTHHGYFNLDGGPDVLEHLLTMPARRFLPVDAGLIPTGELRPVAGTPMDFTRPRPIGARLHDEDPQLGLAGGYDHCFALDQAGAGLVPAARLEGPVSGRVLEVLTTEPGLQLYTGNFLDGTTRGRGRVHGRHAGLCLEAQRFPDTPNHPDFPSTVLRPGETYRATTVYRFSAH
jgi:aldose 1-epimerase